MQLMLDEGESGTQIVEASLSQVSSLLWPLRFETFVLAVVDSLLTTAGEALTLTMNPLLQFIVLAILAGQLNSGYNAAWVLCFLALDPHWKHEVRAEVDRAVAKHRSSPAQKPLDGCILTSTLTAFL